jgi:hypothetical protein
LLSSETYEPLPREWAELAVRASRRGAYRDVKGGDFRAQIGLPEHPGPLVMSGHQAEIWHAGIAAKYFAMHTLTTALRASGSDATCAWLVVDQDDNDPRTIRYPALRGSELVPAAWTIDPDALRGPPTGSLGPISAAALARELPAAPATRTAAEGVNDIRRELTRAAGSSRTLAEQFGRAATRLIAPALADSGVEPALAFDTSIARTEAFALLVEAIGLEPIPCVRTYNMAAASVPRAGVRALRLEKGRAELPLWRVRPGVERTPVFSDELGSIPGDQLAPRALLMTAVLRMFACDLFIHGLGGGVYEQINDVWLARWAEVSPAAARVMLAPAPAVVVTATRLVDFSELARPKAPSPEQVLRAAWLEHSAAHNPGALGDEEAAREKARLVAEIRATEDRRVRARLFREMHELLEAVRQQRAAPLASIRDAAARARSLSAEAAVVHDRTWPFPLLGAEQLVDLRDAVTAAFAGVGPSV